MRVSRRGFLLGLTASTAAIVGVVGVKSVQSQPAASPESMTVTKAHAAAKDGQIILVDIRRPDEWRATGIGQGAVPIDMRRTDFVDAVQAVRTDKSLPVALICARGVRSRRTFNALRFAGLSNIIDIPEGMLGSRAGPGWIATGLPLVKWSGQS